MENINEFEEFEDDLASMYEKQQLMSADQLKLEPYAIKKVVTYEPMHNENYEYERKCQCGHPYYRHFDTYNHMEAVGCKYCQCFMFVAATVDESP